MRLDWTEDEHDEYERLLDESWAAAERTRQRVDYLLAGVRDAAQAQRQWAIEVEEEALRVGLASLLKRRAKEQRRLALRDGDRTIDRPAVVGVRRLDADGVAAAVQLELDTLGRDELMTKVREYDRAIATYGDNRAVAYALLALLDEVPEAATPREAAASLGTTVEAWLLGDAA